MPETRHQEGPTYGDAGNAVRADVAHVLQEIIRRRAQTDASSWTEATPFSETGLNSFDAIECVFELEEHYKVDIDFNANDPESKMEKISDFIDMAVRAIEGKGKA